MAVVVALLVCVVMVRSEYAASCYNGTATSVSVRPSADGIGGRYEVQFCTAADRSVTHWDLVMSFLSSPDTRNCTYEELGERSVGLGVTHSRSTELVSLDLDCTHVCFSKYLDLMFRGCYRLYNKLSRGNFRSETHNTYYFADNNIQGPEYFRNAILVKELDYDNTVIFNWYQSHIPITEYDIEMQSDNESNDEWLDVRGNCSASADVLRCELWPAEGCYWLQLTYFAPWTAGLLADLNYRRARFCHEPRALLAPGGASWARPWWWAAAGSGLALAALLSLLAWQSRLAHKLRRRVLHYWIHSASVRDSGASMPDGEPGIVLVLYAREAKAERAVALLRRLLEASSGGQVVDVHSAWALGQAAVAPGEWVRQALRCPTSRLLLLQTPALACLASDTRHRHDQPLTLSEPLLPSRVVYRSPQFGDTLLQFALRLLADSPDAIDEANKPYRKYYLATFPELATEVFPHVVPFRRYELPAATEQLLRDLCHDQPATDQPAPDQPATDQPATDKPATDQPATDQSEIQALLAEFSSAAAEFVDHVRSNENYLADELIFL